MAFVTEPFSRRVLFNDGEGIDPEDLNNLGLFFQESIVGNLLGSAVPDGIADPLSPGDVLDLNSGSAWNQLGLDYTGLVLAPFPGCAYVGSTGVANQLYTVPGPIVLPLGEPFSAGSDPLWCMRLPQVTLTTAVGHATLVRFDLVEIAASAVDADPTPRDFEDAATRAHSSANLNKTRRLSFEIRIKQGTPGAGYPAPTAGAFAIAAIRIPATHNAAHSTDNLRDLRVPLGNVDQIDVLPKDFYLTGANPWAVADGSFAAFANATGTDPIYIPCPIAAKSARLIGVGLYGTAGPSAACGLYRMLHGGATQLIADTADLFDTAGYRVRSMVQLMDDADTGGAIYPGTRAAGTRIGTPIWADGTPSGVANLRSADPGPTVGRLALRVASEDVASVAFARFYLAKGL